MCGHGTQVYVDGSRYVGEFQGNRHHGHGTFTHVGGEEYIGAWVSAAYPKTYLRLLCHAHCSL